MKKVLKKNEVRFVSEVIKWLRSMGATETVFGSEIFNAFEINTSVGKLTINILNKQEFGYHVFSRFEDVERAKIKLDCNPYSGKYNVHQSGDTNVDLAINSVISHFEPVLN